MPPAAMKTNTRIPCATHNAKFIPCSLLSSSNESYRRIEPTHVHMHMHDLLHGPPIILSPHPPTAPRSLARSPPSPADTPPPVHDRPPCDCARRRGSPQ